MVTSNFTQIQQKLAQFSKKYYTNELIKGSILFITLGVLYFLFTLFIEYFLWLKPTARTVLFWLFIVIELFLLIRFIGFPIFKLFGLQKGISSEHASDIIGNHFPEVKDKLLNVLQLQQNSSQSELLLASIEQKSIDLQPIPFSKAINFKANISYLKYALIPVCIWLLIFITGFNNKLQESFTRVVNHKIAYTPPAPFSFQLTNNNLKVIQGDALTIYAETVGEVTPENAKIIYNNQEYYLENNGSGLFSYTFDAVMQPIDFYIEANKVQSNNYAIEIIKTPTIQNVQMQLNYPRYVGKKNEVLPNTTNVNVPQGTIITWNVKTTETDSVNFIFDKKRKAFQLKENGDFTFSKSIRNTTNYKISSSNKSLKDYESLQFYANVIKDENPTISVTSNIDSISRGPVFFAGQLADDYGLSKLELVYYDVENSDIKQKQNISISKEAIQSFFYKFPENIDLKERINYELYFQVFDNDAVNGKKKAVSKTFFYRQKTTNEVAEELLKEQEEYINNLENSIDKQRKSKQDLEKIQLDLQNKKSMNWNDQKKIEKIVKRQEQYKQMMQRQTKKLQENFSEKKEQTESLQEKKEDLQKRIDELKKVEKQQKLLEELLKMAEKLDKEELLNKTKELAEQNKQQEKSLERILEMTKRFYVEQKMNQIADKLNDLAKKQNELANKNATTKEQEEINKEFNKAKEQLKKLEKENEQLKEPMDVPKMQDLKYQAQEQLNKADKNLEQNKPGEAKQNQQKAAQKMQQMSNKMQKSMQGMSGEMAEENMEGLRKILENLLTFSFDQEKLMKSFDESSTSDPNYGSNLKKQYQLKTYFEHIDDSLFVLSMRVPKISSEIQNHLADAHYNIDQSLDNFAQNRFRNGLSNQRYVITAANTLIDMLSNNLDAMKNAKPGSGKGKGKKQSFSLPDIIQKQSDLIEKMKEGMKKSNEGKPKNGEGKKQGKGKGGKGEEMNGELYEIFKQQNELKQQLNDAIENGLDGNGNAKKALQKMEQLENELLERGFNNTSLQRMQQLNYELLKLEKATFEQGKDKKRKATTNTKQYNNQSKKELEFKKQFYNQTEILNRQSLPLQENYRKKVQEYFSNQKQ